MSDKQDSDKEVLAALKDLLATQLLVDGVEVESVRKILRTGMGRVAEISKALRVAKGKKR